MYTRLVLAELNMVAVTMLEFHAIQILLLLATANASPVTNPPAASARVAGEKGWSVGAGWRSGASILHLRLLSVAKVVRVFRVHPTILLMMNCSGCPSLPLLLFLHFVIS